jgi:amidohydrolase
MDYLAESLALFDFTRTLRRDFHRHPELGFQEFRTAGVVARELNALGLEVTTGIAKTGVVALLEGAQPGPVVLMRFDMDALPITEATGAEYASQNPGVMHACGHDGHTAIGLTVARMLAARREELSGTFKFVFQPAEEGLGGAEGMIAEGVLENPRPDVCFSLHLWNSAPYGWLGIAPGPVMAASEIFSLLVTGKGGHGAMPSETIDPVIASAHIVTALQTIVARNVPPLQPAVVTVATIHGGEAHNVIPSQVKMSGTIRSFDESARKVVLERFRQVVTQTAAALGCTVEIDLKSLTPAVVNQAEATAHVLSVARQILPQAHFETELRIMGSEDMAFMQQQVPGCYFFVGSSNPALGLDAPHHHPRFDVDERALHDGAALMAAAAAGFAGR